MQNHGGKAVAHTYWLSKRECPPPPPHPPPPHPPTPTPPHPTPPPPPQQATSHYLNQCWPGWLTHICSTMGDELNWLSLCMLTAWHQMVLGHQQAQCWLKSCWSFFRFLGLSVVPFHLMELIPSLQTPIKIPQNHSALWVLRITPLQQCFHCPPRWAIVAQSWPLIPPPPTLSTQCLLSEEPVSGGADCHMQAARQTKHHCDRQDDKQGTRSGCCNNILPM